MTKGKMPTCNEVNRLIGMVKQHQIGRLLGNGKNFSSKSEIHNSNDTYEIQIEV